MIWDTAEKSDRIDQNPGNNDQVADDLSFRDLFSEDKMRKQKDKNIGSSINYRTITHIYFGVTPGIQQKDQHKDGIGYNYAYVQVFSDPAFIFDIGTLLEQYLGDSREKSSPQHN